MTETDKTAGPNCAPMIGIGESWRALVLLFIVYFASSMDRTIMSIAGQPIKEALSLADWQLGLLNGFAFSLLYVALGFPLGRLADRGNRVGIIFWCLTIWSAMTALCGLSGNFGTLFAFRMGVGVGEAGCLPTSHSLISDYFAPRARTVALAIFGLGLPLGALAGMILGGAIIDWAGWRAAFLILGLPGCILAVVVRLAVREPRQRASHPEAAGGEGTPHLPLGTALRTIFALPAVRHVFAGVTIATVVTSPGVVFLAPYLTRSFKLDYTTIGLALGVTQMGGIALSTLAGGVVSSRLGRHDPRWYLWVPAISLAIGGPLFAATYAQPSWERLVALLFVASLTGAAYLPPSYAFLYANVRPQLRATTAAVVGILMNLLGLSLGPFLCGLSIDWLSRRLFVDGGGVNFAANCLSKTGPIPLSIQCQQAAAHGTQIALIGFSLLTVWPALHFLYAARLIRKVG